MLCILSGVGTVRACAPLQPQHVLLFVQTNMHTHMTSAHTPQAKLTHLRKPILYAPDCCLRHAVKVIQQ